MSETTEPQSQGIYDSPEDANKDGTKGEVKKWLEAIQLAADEEQDWRKDVEEAEKVFKAAENLVGTKYNIYHANIQTIIPALYNSTPTPDIRRRFNDKDPIGKESCQILERCLSYAVDTYDFDGSMTDTVKDLSLTSRGVARVTYDVRTGPMTGEGGKPVTDVNGEPIEDVTYQAVGCHHVPWASFRRGPGRSWDEVPWVAFAQYYSKTGLKALAEGIDISKISMDMRLGEDKDGADKDKPAPDIYKRSLVWEVWDKETKTVKFVCEGYKEKLIAETDDPLELEQFFPIPKPMMGTMLAGCLVPICDHKILKPLLDECDVVTKRISRLIKQLRVRGAVPGGSGIAGDMKRVMEADDGELVEIAGATAWLDKGGMAKLVEWFPLEPIVQAIKVLYERRTALVQEIYEISGLSDIIRGQSDPNETLGAQEIKQKWGSLRIQKRQQEVQRFVRDLFRLKSEIIANKFTPQQIQLMAGLNVVPDPPPAQAMPGQPPQPTSPAPPGSTYQSTFDQVMKLFKDDLLRSYKIDIETDSTIAADLTRNQQAMTQFVEGTAGFMQAAQGALAAGIPKELLLVIYSSFARNFKLGKEVEDVLDGLVDMVRGSAGQEQADPEAEKNKAEVEAVKAKAEIEGQKGQMDLKMKEAEMGLKNTEVQQKLQQGQAQHQQNMQHMQERGMMQKMMGGQQNGPGFNGH